MSKWIHGRYGRPIASILSMLMLVSLLLPLAPHPAQAEDDALAMLMGTHPITPTLVVVVDSMNESDYRTGWPGRTFADALSVELVRTKNFVVVKREDVAAVMNELNLNIPLSWEQQAMVADRMNTPTNQCPFTISGSVDEIKVKKGKEGTYAEVSVSTVVISRVLKLPINGARISVRSSPKIGYAGSPDLLVQEALSTAAYQVAQQLLENRLPIATVLNSPRNGEVELRGGSTFGFREGMVLIAMRRETPTGRLRLTRVTSNSSEGLVLSESRGIAPGDKAVPIFQFPETVRSVTPETKARAGHMMVGMAMLAGIAILVGTNGGTKNQLSMAAPFAAPVADPGNVYPGGGNIVTWPRAGDRIACYLLYRNKNPNVPIAVLNADQTSFVDDATPLRQNMKMENTVATVTLTPDTGVVTTTRDVTLVDSLETLNQDDLQVDDATVTVTCHRVPLAPGEACTYQVRSVVIAADPGTITDDLHFMKQYRLELGSKSATSNLVTLTAPPVIDEASDPLAGDFRCFAVDGATAYKLQFSTDSAFNANVVDGNTVPFTIDVSTDIARATVSLTALVAALHLTQDTEVFWRFGAKDEARPDPVALWNFGPYHKAWVFASPPPHRFLLPKNPPPPPGRAAGVLSTVGPHKGTVSQRGSGDRRGSLRP